MERRRNLEEAQALMPLLRSVALEIRDRRIRIALLRAERREIVQVAARQSPEGFTRVLQDLDLEIETQDRAIESCIRELRGIGLRVPSIQPLIIHIPGTSEGRRVTFCWEEGVHALEDEETPSSPQRAAS